MKMEDDEAVDVLMARTDTGEARPKKHRYGELLL